MSFDGLDPLDRASPGIHIAPYSTPTPLEFQGNMYVFYNGSGNDGIWYTTTSPARTFTRIVNIRSTCPTMCVARNTGPSTVVYNGLIYVFFNGVGNDGPWYTTNNGTNDNWSPVQCVLWALGGGPSFNSCTSPTVAVHQGLLYLFWVGPGPIGGLPGATFNGQTWKKFDMPDLGVYPAPQTSPYLVSFKNILYVFYNGIGHDGTCYARFSSSEWLPAASVKHIIGEQGFLHYTSPWAALWGDRLCVTWTGSGGDGVWFTLTDGENWAAQISAKTGSDVRPGTTGGMMVYRYRPWLFVCKNSDLHLWYSFGRTYTLDTHTDFPHADPETLGSAIRNGVYFSVYSFNPTLYEVFSTKFGEHWKMPHPPNLGQLQGLFGESVGVDTPTGLMFWAMMTVILQRSGYYDVSVTTDPSTQSFVVAFSPTLAQSNTQ